MRLLGHMMGSTPEESFANGLIEVLQARGQTGHRSGRGHA